MAMQLATGSLGKLISHEDLREGARRRLPRVLFDFVEGGAGGEHTLRCNRAAFDAVSFRPRKAAGVDAADVRTCVLGTQIACPVLIAPCGQARLIHPDGELALARAAARAGIVYVAPHMAGHSLETVAQAGDPARLWYQLYTLGGRAVWEPAVRRAQAAGYRALVLTIDNPPTVRERDQRNGMAVLMQGAGYKALPRLGRLLARPRWLAAYLADGAPLAFPNAVGTDGRPMLPGQMMAANAAPGGAISWREVERVREIWSGPLVVKGLLTAEDGRRAVQAGVDAMIVSNHGGRGLDGEPAALRALPEVVEAVAGRAEVLMDGGVRRATDVVKALALGARAVLLGRLPLYGLAHGEAGVQHALATLTAEVRRTVAALGAGSVAVLDSTWVDERRVDATSISAGELAWRER